MRRCLLARHAWPDNPRNLAYGVDIKIDRTHDLLQGKVEAVADLLRGESFSATSSPAARCTETTELVLQAAGVRNAYVTMPGLLEQNWGSWTDVPRGQIPRTELLDYLMNPDDLAPPNGESMHMQRKRVLPAFQRAVIDDTITSCSLVVSHGGTMRSILSQILEVPMSEILRQKSLQIRPLDVLELRIPDSVRKITDYKHIDWQLHNL